MRKNVPVTFINKDRGKYDPFTDTYTGGKENTVVMWCNVTDMTSEQSFKEFGEYIQGGIVVRTTTPVALDTVEFLEVNGKRYAVRSMINALGRSTVKGVKI